MNGLIGYYSGYKYNFIPISPSVEQSHASKHAGFTKRTKGFYSGVI